MKTEITLKNLQRKIRIKSHPIEKITKIILRREGITSAFLSIVFVTDRKIRSLNKRYLGRNYPTDILAFDLSKEIPLLNNSQRNSLRRKEIIGEIIISADTAVRNAETYRTKLEKEIVLYVAHGILHLLGYDDHKACDIRRMRQKEKLYLGLLYR